jgi:8-oxo-dGTP diphosphatase
LPEVELAAAIVVLNDHVLIVRRSETEGFLPSRWGVPCGKLGKDEPPQKAVLRELREETGLEGKVVAEVGRSDFPSLWRGLRVRNVQYNYLIEPRVDPAMVDQDGMPRVKLPKPDQAAEWIRTERVGAADLDEHNLRTINQGLGALSPR